jgi:putative addiction module CopG family antidote
VDVTLKPEVRRFVEEQVKTGRFSSPDEVLEAGVARLMLDSEEPNLDEQTLKAIEHADAQLDRGEGVSAIQAFQRLRAKYSVS